MNVTKNIYTCDDCPYKLHIYEQGLCGDFCGHIDCKNTFLQCSNVGIPKECPILKKGQLQHWIANWITDDEGDWHCSFCGAIIERYEQGWHHYRYCYHCGSRMNNVDIVETE